jgi:hypothetical protein
MSVPIDPSQVTGVLLDGSAVWLPVADAEFVAVSGAADWAQTLAFQSDGGYVYAPSSTIVGLRTRRKIKTPEQIEAEQRVAEAREARRFEFLTYGATIEQWLSIGESQSWLCADGRSCGSVDLREAPLTHLVGSAILCSACSPLKTRFGGEFDALDFE